MTRRQQTLLREIETQRRCIAAMSADPTTTHDEIETARADLHHMQGELFRTGYQSEENQ